jgi:hypothetical protein
VPAVAFKTATAIRRGLVNAQVLPGWIVASRIAIRARWRGMDPQERHLKESRSQLSSARKRTIRSQQGQYPCREK